MKRGEVLQVVAVVILQFVGLLQQPKVLAQVTDVGGDPEYSTFGREEYSPYLNQNFPQRVFGGETHVLTACATDSGLFGTRLGPDEAYRFAKSEEVISQNPEGLCTWMARYEDKTQLSAHNFPIWYTPGSQPRVYSKNERAPEWNSPAGSE